MRQLGFLLLSLVGGFSLSCPPTDTRVTAAVQAIVHSLPMLEAGSRGSADQRECFTCHNQALPVFALLEAKKRGFTIEETNLRRQVQHTFDHLSRGLDLYKEGKGQGGGVLTAGYALWTLDKDGHQPEAVAEAVAQYLLGMQKPDGSWQHRGNRPPSSGSDFTASYVALRALEHYGTKLPEDQLADCKARAGTWLLGQEPTETEDLVFRLLSLKYVGAPTEVVQENAMKLLSQQRDDGGWGQMPSMSSDPYATATTLVALLEEGGIMRDDPRVQRGIDYLLRTQQKDGTWHVVTRAKPFQVYFESGFPHGADQFISISASAWATIALLLVLPDEPNIASAK